MTCTCQKNDLQKCLRFPFLKELVYSLDPCLVHDFLGTEKENLATNRSRMRKEKKKRIVLKRKDDTDTFALAVLNKLKCYLKRC